MDIDVLGALLDQRADALAVYASQWTELADDCVQEAFIELARQPTMPDQPVAWLYRVVKNKALNAARSARRRRQREWIAWRDRLALSASSAQLPCDANAALELVELVDRLTPPLREIVVLRIWSGLSFPEIAVVVESSSSTVHRQYVNALQQVKDAWSCANSIPRTIDPSTNRPTSHQRPTT